MSHQQQYNLIYAGAVLSGFDESQVKKSFTEKMKVPSNKVERLFSGKRIVLQKSISKQKAESWQKKLLQIGAESVVIPAVSLEGTDEKLSEEKIIKTNSKVEINKTKSAEKSQQSSEKKKISDDDELTNKINQAKALIAAQQMEQQLKKSKQTNPFKRLLVFSGILVVAIFLFYIYVDSIF